MTWKGRAAGKDSVNTIVVCCETIKDELQYAVAETSRAYPVVWIQSGLHNFPDRLRTRLQEALDEIAGYDRVLLGFGYCGNAIAEIRTGDFELVVPRADDCITIMLGSPAARKKYESTYFLTKGWLDGEKNIWWEYNYTIGKYGRERGRDIYDMVLKNYTELGVLDTGAYDLEALRDQTEEIAKELGLVHRILPATTDYIRDLLTGPWPDDRFLTVPPRHTISAGQLLPGG